MQLNEKMPLNIMHSQFNGSHTNLGDVQLNEKTPLNIMHSQFNVSHQPGRCAIE